MSPSAAPPISPLQLALVRSALGAFLILRFGGLWWGAAIVPAVALMFAAFPRAAAAVLLAGVATLIAGSGDPWRELPVVSLLVIFMLPTRVVTTPAAFAALRWTLVASHLLWAAVGLVPGFGGPPCPPAPLAMAHVVAALLLAVSRAQVPAWLVLGVLTLGEAILLPGVWAPALGLALLHLLAFDARWLPVRDDERRPVLLYDGECGLCAAVVRAMLREDAAARLRFAPLQGAAAQDYLRARGLPTSGFDSLVFVPDWERPEAFPPRLRSDGALAAADEPGGLCRVFSWVRIVPRPALDAAYRAVARARGIFGRPACSPAEEPAWSSRFLR
jgi:predicted DCC family thiol-disulfide oxidoreductase YuxK